MHLQNERDPILGQSRLIVLLMGTVCGSDLDQPRTGPRHDIRHPERATDLDQLPTGYDCTPAMSGKSVEDEQNGGGVVVDQRCVFRAGQLADQRTQMVVTFATLAAGHIEFERDGAAHCRRRSVNRSLCQHRAPKIRMQHSAGEVEDRTQRIDAARLDLCQSGQGDAVRIPDLSAPTCRLSLGFKLAADGRSCLDAPETGNQFRAGLRTENGINRRNRTKTGIHGQRTVNSRAETD